MVSAFTSALYEGDKEETFERFVLRCTRAMDFRWREEGPVNHTLPDLEKIEAEELAWRKELLTDAQERLAAALKDRDEVLAMTEEEVAIAAQKSADRTFAFFTDIYRTSKPVADRFQAMKAKVDAWTPPTPKHDGLKRFMLEQLAHHLTAGEEPTLSTTSPEKWKEERLSYCNRSVEIHQKDVDQKQELMDSPTEAQWLRDILDSLR